MIPINNPDPEISDRSYNQSKVSPEAARQAGSHSMRGARLTHSQFSRVLPWSVGCGISGLKSSPSSSGVSRIIDMFDNHR